MNGKRFVLNIGSIREEFPDMPEQNGADVTLWDRQEQKAVVTIHGVYTQAICLEQTTSPEHCPFTTLENFFNSLSNKALESEGMPPTKS